MKYQIFVAICMYSLTVVSTAHILAIFPLASRSHFQFNSAVIRSLYNAGHQITFITPFPTLIQMPNATAIDSKTDNTAVYVSKGLFEYMAVSLWGSVQFWKKSGIQGCHDVLNLKEIQEILHSGKSPYDIMIIQLQSMYQCYLPLAQKLDIPVIGTATTRTWREATLAVGDEFNPAALRQGYGKFSNSWNLLDRLHNLDAMLRVDIFYYFSVPPSLDQIYLQYYGSDFQLNKHVSLMFINSHASFVSKPSVPNSIEVAGIHVKPVSPLPENMKRFLDDAEEGVIVFSLGSVTKGSSQTNEMRNAFMTAFSKVPQKILWKFEDPLENVPANVMLMKWLPQRDILAHKNVKAFMSHCGVSGVYEAISEAVPMVLLPMFGDQPSNAAILVEQGVGVYLDLLTVTPEKVLNALNAVINDTRYATNMKLLSQRFKDRPMSPQESVVYWTEYVIRHKGATHLRTRGADLPLYQYLMLDILAFIALILMGALFSLIWLIKRLKKLAEKHQFDRLYLNKKID